MYKKILLKGKYFLWAPPPQDPPTQTPLPSLVLELFLLCYFAFIFLTGGGWMYCCWRECEDAEGHT